MEGTTNEDRVVVDEFVTASELPRVRSRIGSREALRFLSDAGQTLASSLDYETTLQSLAELAVPRVACFCVVDVLEPDGSLRRLGTAHVDPSQLDLLNRTPGRFRIPREGSHLETMLTVTEPVLVSPVSDDWLQAMAGDESDFDLTRQLLPTSLLLVPLYARQTRLGVLVLASTRVDRHYGTEDSALARELGRIASLAIDNARLYRRAQDAIQARDEVLRVVSHDLRNPIGAVSMGAALLLELESESTRNPVAGRTLATIQRAADQASRMIEDLLDVSRIEAGKLAVERYPLDLGATIDETVELHRGLAGNRQITIERAGDIALPLIHADHHRLLQIFGNLIGNALKFTPAGGRIEVGAATTENGVRCWVGDSGPGIPADHLPHLFDRFWQARRTDRRGLGLGLAIVRGLVEAHAGQIRAESEVGRGSTFIFTLPQRDPES